MKDIKREDFYAEVYSVVREIPCGKVATYGQIAMLIGRPQNSRMVGQAMARTPELEILPCHRVVNSQGRLVPGWERQRELLENEGVVFRQNGDVNLKRCGWKPDEIY